MQDNNDIKAIKAEEALNDDEMDTVAGGNNSPLEFLDLENPFRKMLEERERERHDNDPLIEKIHAH